MTILEFPAVETADEHGLLAVGGDLEIDSLLLAYKGGIFPWPFDKRYPAWFAPPMRAVLFLSEFHIPQSLKKLLKKPPFTFTHNRDFASVIRHCAKGKNRADSPGTWITPGMIKAYTDLHHAGYAESIEAWDSDGTLAGGLYAVKIGGLSAGESMFYLKANASKLAFCHFISLLKERNTPWLDCQILNPLTASFGAREIPRDEYQRRLSKLLTA